MRAEVSCSRRGKAIFYEVFKLTELLDGSINYDCKAIGFPIVDEPLGPLCALNRLIAASAGIE